MYKKLAVIFMAALLFTSAVATAGTDELAALMKKSLDEAKEAGAKYENDSCGHIFVAQGEYVRTKDGKSENHLLNWTPESSWGCNSASLGDEKNTSKFESRESTQEDGATVQHIANAHGIYHFDPEPSTEIAGSVMDKDSKPVKDAEVKAENIDKNRPAITGRTDADGKYSLKVSSGQYRVTAKTASCHAEETLWACSYGKILDTRTHVRHFALDLVAECGGMDLNLAGTATQNVKAQMQGIKANVARTDSKMKGKVPLTLDSETGKITGKGKLGLDNFTSALTGTIQGAPVSGKGSHSSTEWQITVDGNLNAATGVASLTCDCTQVGTVTSDVNVQVRGVNVSSTVTDKPESCAGSGWAINFDIPWKVGESHHVDRVHTFSLEGINATNHEVIDLTLGEKAKDEAATDKETGDENAGSADNDSGGDKPAPPQKASGGYSFNIPVCAAGEDDSEQECIPADALDEIPAEVRKHMNLAPPETE